jgi:DNA-directed RNA polymerase subunit RPC12/RpoP
MAYQFVTKCVSCAKEFGILWVMDSNRIGHDSVARITCPLCGKRFNQLAKDLLPIASPIQKLVLGRPVRSVEIDYDCPYCGNRGILVSLLHTDLSWAELSKEEASQTAACDSGLCSRRGALQKLKPTRVLLGSLNPN